MPRGRQAYERLAKIEEDYQFLLLAQERIANGSLAQTVSWSDAIQSLGISETEISKAEDVEIE